ncbi:hypothetical protein AGOR_G00100520 [Albula goreensis]|uniref:DNA replication ATP-dependent helicase/nuclease n=1 Tax=Albula goreensis TaxID=1534307 RepID=A0A8T3DKF4_9TELE|nr:hypothetical protein AGOR_G00100520 [Albula goreensis]
MNKNKLKKSRVGNGGQKNIESFFSTRETPLPIPKETGFQRDSVNVKSMVLSLLGGSDEETENLPPSLEPLYVPETPDSPVRPSRLLRQPLQEASSPVSRFSCSSRLQSSSLTCKRPVLSSGGRGEISRAPCLPVLQNRASESGSVKRLLCSPEGPQQQKAKRLKAKVKRVITGTTPPTAQQKPTSPAPRQNPALPTPQQNPSPPARQPDPALDECLSAIGASVGRVMQESARKAWQTQEIGMKPVLVNGLSSKPTARIKASSLAEYESFSTICEHRKDSELELNSSSEQAHLSLQVTCHSMVEPRDFEEVACPQSRGGRDTQPGSLINMGGAGQTGIMPQDDSAAVEDFWFADNMELSLINEQEKKLKKQRNIPDHVILSTGLHNRYCVLEVQQLVGPQGFPEKRLVITASKTAEPTEEVILKDGWEDTPVTEGSVVHLEGHCVSGAWTIDRASGFLILMPDLLISGTSIANSISCMRRAVLGEKFKASGGGSRQMLNGTMIHEVFQKAAMSRDFSLESLQQFANQAVHGPKYLRDMYSLELSQPDMLEGIEEYLPALSDWAQSYLCESAWAGTKQLTLALPSEGSISKQDAGCSVTVTDFLDIEENIWSPRFGLKGKMDLTAGVRIQRRSRRQQERVVALELKTGKESNSIEHRSQVILYTLMSLERRSDAELGFLLYLKTGSMHPIIGSHMDRRELMKLRNTLAHYLGNSVVHGEDGKPHLATLPDIITNQQVCKYCPQIRTCALYSRAVEHSIVGSFSGQDQPAFLEQETQHLGQAHLQYFSHWFLLCAMEESTMESRRGRHKIWLLSAEERQQHGGCIGSLRRTGPVEPLSDDSYVHRFKPWGREKVESGLMVGDRVVLSEQELKLIALATGYVTEVTVGGVTCMLDRNLSKYPSETLFRLDQDEGVGGMDTHFRNLAKLMDNSPRSAQLRELIVDYRAPRFIENLSSVLPREAKNAVASILKGLNKPQKQAMKKVLLSKDYTLIMGMPGTGKTTTICTLIRILHACGFSVLVTSYTHSAVDNILLKLKRFRIGFLRLGREQKVHPDILPFTEEQQLRARSAHTLPELEQLYSSQLVVATTCMGVKHPIFSRKLFDFCIVDEASQISQPVCLGPLFYAERFVLVGDHQQLPPIVQNSEARSLGMDESLFKRLECHRDAVVQLTVQYRMNSKIMSLSNTLVYGGQLECGSEQTARALLQLPAWGTLEQDLQRDLSRVEHRDWVRAALQPENPVCFLDTAMVPAPESVQKGGVSNPTEATLVHYLVSLLLKAGCRSGDIGVIAPYRQQLKEISTLMRGPAFSAVEVNTVDKYQGRDKSVIIVSFVRNTEEGNLGELLKDWRRLNVAITRAKHKLIMLGSASTSRRYTPLERLLGHLEQESMISFTKTETLS